MYWRYLTLILALLSLLRVSEAHAQRTLLNVSYDPTRELYQNFNAAFAKYWKTKSGESV
jgi:sulfate transport system substrate-binding protein